MFSKLLQTLGKSLGLLGKPIEISNEKRTFGSAAKYWAIQIEDAQTGEESVLLLTAAELQRAKSRAAKNPEDVVRFLKEHSVADSLD